MARRIRTAAVAVLGSAALVLSGCGGGSASPTNGVDSVLRVSAAASLSAAFNDLAAQFEAANPGVDVQVNYAGSSSLAEQIVQGAPVDVFASASTSTAESIADLLDAQTPFTRNFLQIAVPAANAAGVASASDLARPGVTVAVCQEQVPCGAAARPILQALGVQPVTLEPDVKSVLGKVVADEVDAGIVYVTDVRAAGAAVSGVDVPVDLNPGTTYPIARVRASTSAFAQPFIDLVLSAAGQEVLGAYGFSSP